MGSWNWVAKTLKHLRLANQTPSSSPATPSIVGQQSRSPPHSPPPPPTINPSLLSAIAAVPPPPPPTTTTGGITVPPRPKKPLTPYFRYLGQVRDQVRKANPNLKITDVMKKVAAQWDQLDEAGKGRYISAYKKDMESFSSILDKYRASLTPEQTALQEELKMEKHLKKEKRDKKRRVKELGRPKKPMSGFLLYLRSQAKPGQSIVEYQSMAKQLGLKWKGMSEGEKAPFVSKYKTDYIAYEKDLKKWEDKMLKQGNDDLVRVGYLTKVMTGKINKSR